MIRKVLIRSAFELARSDGLRILAEQTIRYLTLHGKPHRVGNYWWNKLLGKTEQIVRIEGSLMKLNLKDRGIHADLFISRMREPQATAYLQQIMRPDWAVIEIGANIGYYALMEARKVKTVYAIEPDITNCKNITQNIQLNSYDNIKLFNMAIGDRKGLVDFHLADNCNLSRIATKGTGVSIQVPITTLDDFVDNFVDSAQVDFLRMDVEGYEIAILRGADKVLRTYRPQMFIEVHRNLLRDYGSSQLELMELLADYGYYITKSFVLGRDGPCGSIRSLLMEDDTRRAITERGRASHVFFSPKWTAPKETA